MTANYNLKRPLSGYPWREDVVKIASWSKKKTIDHRAFAFDVCMSLAYIDSSAGIERHVQFCPSCPQPYDAHVGFINLCSPCYEGAGTWRYQKAAKPQSGVLGKLSSEMVLCFVDVLYDDVVDTYSIGGTELADAQLNLVSGEIVLAEVKAAPLLTYPLIVASNRPASTHSALTLTTSQFRELESALYAHGRHDIPLGEVGAKHWPFQGAADFLCSPSNRAAVDKILSVWKEARDAYKCRDKESPYYYLANASGNPPAIARNRDSWPSKKSISDGKTSAGLDRTDDIKKGVYQALKLGTMNIASRSVRTALISNLPAYRHGEEYLDPFAELLWGESKNLISNRSFEYMRREDMRHVFDYIITLTGAAIR